jgi:nicotinamidase-related amidase
VQEPVAVQAQVVDDLGGRDVRRYALVVVDVQQGFDDPSWGRRNNPGCEDAVAALLAGWRAAGAPVVLVRHDSVSGSSPLRPGHPGNDLRPGVDGPHDLLVTKSVNSSFHGSPDLDAWLRANDVPGMVVCGITTNHCCETTARVGGNLGHDVLFALDATCTFDRVGPDGVVVDADTLARVTAANLHGEFAHVTSSEVLLRALGVAPAAR